MGVLSQALAASIKDLTTRKAKILRLVTDATTLVKEARREARRAGRVQRDITRIKSTMRMCDRMYVMLGDLASLPSELQDAAD